MSEQTEAAHSPNADPWVLLLGGSGTIGRATLAALLEAGCKVRCVLRNPPQDDLSELTGRPEVDLRIGYPGDAGWLRDEVLGDGAVESVISCVASRSGAPADAWAVDYGVNKAVLSAAVGGGVDRFILLSAICVQKPLLGFQKAKLAFEDELMASGLAWSIVRPTAFFKSLSGQLERLRNGKPFLVFGNGQLTACKPISDHDLGRFIVGCLTVPERQNRILSIGGPGPALTPLEQGEALFAALGKQPEFRHVPVALLDTIIGVLRLAGVFSAKARDKAELARIGRYYATESMLVLDPDTGTYSDDKTPEFGQDTLPAFYRDLVSGVAKVDRGEHAVF